mmetsp:Transcript_27404/g.63176  ORF Transcript_27404/g.63176 Transcript_27404/m.63176 type:complete len:1200 (-) Transcript_27404:425-4024(-)
MGWHGATLRSVAVVLLTSWVLGAQENLLILSPIAIPEGRAMAAAALLALRHVNQKNFSIVQSELPLDLDLSLNNVEAVDTWLSPVHGFDRLLDHAKTTQLLGVVGPETSTFAAPVASLAQFFNFPVVSYSATAPPLSDKLAYPLFARTAPSDAVSAQGTIQLLRHFGWRHACIIWDQDDLYTSFYQRTLRSLAGPKDTTFESYPYQRGNADSIRAAVSEIRDTRVVIALAASSDVERIMITANELGAAGEERVWIWSESAYFSLSVIPIAEASRLDRLMQGSLTLMSGIPDTKGSAVFGKAMRELDTSSFQADIPGLTPADLEQLPQAYGRYAYDCVWLLALARSQAAASAHDGSALVNAMRSVVFQGASGRVQLDSSLDRLGSTATMGLYNLRPNLRLEKVGTLANGTQLNLFKAPRFRDGTSAIPSDGLNCATDPTWCPPLTVAPLPNSPSDNQPWVISLAACVIVLLALLSAAAVYICRRSHNVASSSTTDGSFYEPAPSPSQVGVDSGLLQVHDKLRTLQAKTLRSCKCSLLRHTTDDICLGFNEILCLLSSSTLTAPRLKLPLATSCSGPLQDEVLDDATRSWLFADFFPTMFPPASPSQSPGPTSQLPFTQRFSADFWGMLGEPDSTSYQAKRQLKELLIESSTKWNADVFEIHRLSQGHTLAAVAYHIIWTRGLCERLELPTEKLQSLLLGIESKYKADAYHTAVHATEVLLAMNYFLNIMHHNMSSLEQLACLLAAAAHDCDHKGMTNAFHVNAGDDIALMHNDKSVLENHHLTTFFNLLQLPQNDITEHMPAPDRKELRRLLIELVLATDLAMGFDVITAFKARFSKNEPSVPDQSHRNHRRGSSGSASASRRGSESVGSEQGRVSPDMGQGPDKEVFLKMAIKCADLAHVAKPFDTHEKWSSLLCEEFFAQGDIEKERGLSVLPHMDRTQYTPQGFATQQVGFFDFVALPMWEPWAKATCLHEELSAVRANRMCWHLASRNPDSPTCSQTGSCIVVVSDEDCPTPVSASSMPLWTRAASPTDRPCSSSLALTPLCIVPTPLEISVPAPAIVAPAPLHITLPAPSMNRRRGKGATDRWPLSTDKQRGQSVAKRRPLEIDKDWGKANLAARRSDSHRALMSGPDPLSPESVEIQSPDACGVDLSYAFGRDDSDVGEEGDTGDTGPGPPAPSGADSAKTVCAGPTEHCLALV